MRITLLFVLATGLASATAHGWGGRAERAENLRKNYRMIEQRQTLGGLRSHAIVERTNPAHAGPRYMVVSQWNLKPIRTSNERIRFEGGRGLRTLVGTTPARGPRPWRAVPRAQLSAPPRWGAAPRGQTSAPPPRSALGPIETMAIAGALANGTNPITAIPEAYRGLSHGQLPKMW